jgi:hypothetical protein
MGYGLAFITGFLNSPQSMVFPQGENFDEVYCTTHAKRANKHFASHHTSLLALLHTLLPTLL